jgi:chemotaxis protein methyltransferase CheR
MGFQPTDDLPPLSDAEFRMFRDFFKSACGLSFNEDSRFLLEKRLARRLQDLDLGSYSSYLYMLRKDERREREVASVIDELTTNETYFFRERRQLRALVGEILPELIDRKPRGSGPVSIWSAGCSSGEEPYSIVMLAREAGYEPGRDFRVYASDISRRMLQKARLGEYRRSAFRETEPELRRRYFAEKDGVCRISDDVKRHVVITRVNLIDPARTALLGTMDVILCRNVIIYFDLETKKQVIGGFSDHLHPGGYLLLGHSESLINLSNAFELRHLTNDLVYRKPLPGHEISDPRHVRARAALASIDAEGGLE